MNKKVIIIVVIMIIILIIGIMAILNNKKEKRNDINNTKNTYIPNGRNISNQIENSTLTNIEKINHTTENVTIEIDNNTIRPDSVSIIITDNNENHYGWEVPFKVQEKNYGEWKDLDYVSNSVNWIDITYQLDKNNQIREKLNIEKYYGKLNNGTYRIVKTVYDNGNIDIYSNEFEIK